MAHVALLACDWGTTNLRAWALDEAGSVLADQDFPLGVSRLQPGEAATRFAHEVRPALQAEGVPAVLCGMIGSNLGWALAPYVDCPATLQDLAGGLLSVDEAASIVPGVRSAGFNGRGDVMRGEETQLFGWLAMHPEFGAGRRLVCHPGTHAKWMLVEEGRLTAFVTAMTGELFAVLGEHSLLRTDAVAGLDKDFDDGVAAAGDGDALAARLFTARARIVGMGAPPASAASYLSGLLVGADVAATPALLGCATDVPVALLGDPALCGLYRRALHGRGVEARMFDGEAAAVAGLRALHARGRQR
jgi:2-dehydro-3-deoxygalactonokinase